jgi:DNA-binding NtrC family response regulator
MAKVLLLADATDTAASLHQVLADAGHEVAQLPPLTESLPAAAEAAPDVIIFDKPALQGSDKLIRHFKAHDTLRYCPAIIVTDNPSPDDRLAAIEVGADDYIAWPTAPEELLARLRVMSRIRGLYQQLHQRSAETDLLRTQIEERNAFESIIGNSLAMRRVFDLVSKVIPTNTTVLIIGESGTGKELVARAIHYSGPRHHKNFVIQNCSVLNDNLLESELFGHVRGSFTGAIATKQGLFEVADGGTLFLDEVGDMSPALQVKVLRVLQEGTFAPVGGTQPRHVDVRVISATNRPLEEMVKAGTFREDLYYRLHVFRIDLPPLRDRREDIPLLAHHFLQIYCAENSLANKGCTPEVMDAFGAYNWPGNVRELENEIERAVVMAREDPRITLEHLSPRVREAIADRVGIRGRRIEGRLSDALQELEREMLADGLRRNDWNKSLTARQLGISRANLVAKVKKYRLEPRSGDLEPRDAARQPGAS